MPKTVSFARVATRSIANAMLADSSSGVTEDTIIFIESERYILCHGVKFGPGVEVMTQDEYDALPTKDPNTVYVIKG